MANDFIQTTRRDKNKILKQLCPTRRAHVAQSKVLWGPAWLSLWYKLPILHTDHVSTFLYLGFDIFHAGAPQWHCITSVLYAGKFPYANCHLGAKLFTSFLISTFISWATKLPMKSYLRSA